MWIFWLILLIGFLVAEAATINMTTIWFAGGSLAALIADLSGAGVGLQALIFFVVSIVGLLIFIFVFKPRIDRSKRAAVSTNADRIIGQEGIVTAAIRPISGEGRILVLGQDWSASSEDGETEIPIHAKVRVTGLRGVKAIVVREPEAEEKAE